MSVVTKNMFALLDDEDGPRPAQAANTKAAPAAAGANEKKPGDNKRTTGGGPAARSGRYPGRGGGAKPGPRAENVNEDASEAPKRFDGEKARRGGTRGRGEGRGDGRGRGRGRGGPRGDRPDRHSATGLVDSDKKVHQGWGGDTGDGEQLAEAQGAADAAAATGDWAGAPAADTSGWDAPAGEATNADGTAPAAPANEESEARKAYRERRQKEDEEDESLVTFDEYRKTRNTGLDALVPVLEGRKVESDDAVPKGATKLVKDEDEANYFVGGKTKNSAGRARAPKEKQVIEIDARFDRPRGGGGGERGGGGRGGPRGRGEGRGDYRGASRGRGGPPGASRGGPPRSSAAQKEVNVDDANAFPSLS